MPDPNDPNPHLPPENPETAAALDETVEKSSIQHAMEDALEGSLSAARADGSLTLKTYKLTEHMQKRLLAEFTYHAPRQDQIQRYNALRTLALSFAVMIVELTPSSREQSLALTRISEAIMHANAAIARNEEPKEEPEKTEEPAEEPTAAEEVPGPTPEPIDDTPTPG